jgi:hypothetical protein
MTEFPNPLARGSGVPRARDFAGRDKENPLLTYGSLPARVMVELAKEKVGHLLGLMDLTHEAVFGKGFNIDDPANIPKIMDMALMLGVGGPGPKGSAGAMGGNLFDQNALRAMQRGQKGPPARSGFAYKPEHEANYWQEGGQGHRPGIDDFVEVEPKRNNQEFYDPKAIEDMSRRVREGDKRAALHPIYGPNANRPNYGEVPADYVSPFQRMPEPGVTTGIMPGARILPQDAAGGGFPYGGVAGAAGLGLGAGAMLADQSQNALVPSPPDPRFGRLVPMRSPAPQGQMYNGWPVQAPNYNIPGQVDPRVLAARFAQPQAQAQGQRPSVPLPPSRPQDLSPEEYHAMSTAPATVGNLNYVVTQILDNLFGQHEAERGLAQNP